MVVYDGAHRVDPALLVPTVNAWLDETFGTPKARRGKVCKSVSARLIRFLRSLM